MFKIASRALVPGILIAIALVQQYRAHVYDQSSWIGCGFGMFATLDNHTSRFVQATLISPNGQTPLSIPDELEPLVTRVRVVPSQENLDRLAEAMRLENAQDEEQKAASVQVDLFHVSFDAKTNRLTAEKRLMATVHE